MPQKLLFVGLVSALLVAVGCSDEPVEPIDNQPEQNANQPVDNSTIPDNQSSEDDLQEVVQELRELADALELRPITQPPPQDPLKVELGHKLFFDPILSGNKDTNCFFCHQLDEATADEFPLSAGTKSVRDENGDRRPGPEMRFTPRISPDLFNRGNHEIRTMFWDTRLEQLDDGRIVFHDRSYPLLEGHYYRIMPAEADSLLAAQNLLPAHDRDELRGRQSHRDIFGEFNEVATVADHEVDGTWRRLIARLIEIPGYQELFEQIYPEIPLEDLHFVHATNGLAAFFIESFSFDDSPWDEFLKGDDEALTVEQARGAKLFFEDAGCGQCHGGEILSDQRIYNWAVPPMTRGPQLLDNLDRGAAHRSHAGPQHDFHFRTPPLRNVELTGPYMHNGVLGTLEEVIRHKMNPVESLWAYRPGPHLGPVFARQVHLGEEELAQVERTLSPQTEFVPSDLTDDQVYDLVAFLRALTSPSALDLSHLMLDEVPSGLPIPDPKDRPFMEGVEPL